MGRRYSSTAAILLGLLLSSLGLQGAVVKPDASAVEVAYLLVGSTLYTYDVDRTTGNPTEEGSGVGLESVSNTVVLPSGNDHFIYVTGDDSSNVEWLWVYATDSTGIPQAPAVQAVNLTDSGFTTYDFVISSDGKLGYAAESMYNAQSYTLAKIAEFTIDPTTGMVTKSAKAAATYKQNGPCLLSASAFFFIHGFNPAGNVLYDYWDCNYPFANLSANYYERPVNRSNGALGQDKQIFSWADGTEGEDVVNITPSAIIYFSIPNSTSYGMDSVNVYSLSGAAEFSCTAAMLEACGYGIWNYVDPAGKFDLIELAPDISEVTKIETAAKKLVDTSNYVEGEFLGFSPDDALIYTQQENQTNPWLYPIYVFDPSTGAVTYTGGEIFNNNGGGTVIPALLR
jgi:hypothetical protein